MTPVRVAISLACATPETTRFLEPATPLPEGRLQALRKLREAGIATGLLIAPVVPGLNDHELPNLLERAADAGAQWAAMLPLRLPGSVREVFFERLEADAPGHAAKVRERMDALRPDHRDDTRPGRRHQGAGAYWQSVEQLFLLHRTRLGLDARSAPFPTPSPFHRPGDLFGPPDGRDAGPTRFMEDRP